MNEPTGTQGGPVAMLLQRGYRFFLREIWRTDTNKLPLPTRMAYGVLRVLVLAMRGIIRNRATFSAAGLSFITTLSVVPFLAFAFSVAKGMGAYRYLHDQVILPFLDRTLGVVGPNTPASIASLRDAIDRILELVGGTDVSSLGVLGLTILILAVLRTLSSVEVSFNLIFGVRRPRSLMRKLADYLSLAVITPLLMVLAVTLTTAAQNSTVVGLMQNIPVLSWVVDNLFALTPLLAVWVGFTLLYLILPNTSVPPVPALLGGLVGSGLWQLAQIGHTRLQIGIADYNAIYSSFAAIPIFFVWIYFSWLTVMYGAEFAYALMHAKHYRQMLLHDLDATRSREILALRAVAHIVQRFLEGRAPRSTMELSDVLAVPSAPLARVLQPLVSAGILSEGGSRHRPIWLPGKDPANLYTSDILVALRGDGPEVSMEDDLDRKVLDIYDHFLRVQEDDPQNLDLAALAGPVRPSRGSADPS